MNPITPREWLNGILLFVILMIAVVDLLYYFRIGAGTIKLKGRIFVFSRQDAATTALELHHRDYSSFGSDKVAIPTGIDFNYAFPPSAQAVNKFRADTQIILTWGYVKVGNYQGHANAYTHTCTVSAKTRGHACQMGAPLRGFPPPSISTSSRSSGFVNNVFGSADQNVLDYLKKLPFEQQGICPGCQRKIYPTDAEWACPECGLPARKNMLKKIVQFSALALVYLGLGFSTQFWAWIALSIGLAVFSLWRAVATVMRFVRVNREYPVFPKAAETPDSQKQEQFFRVSAEAWSAGKLKPFVPDSKLHEQSAEELYRQMTSEEMFKPAEGTALRAFFARFSPLPGEFLVAVHDVFVCTNLRMVTKCNAIGNYQLIPLIGAQTCKFTQGRQDIILQIKMRTGKSVKVTGIPAFWPELPALVAQGVFTAV